MLKKIVEQKIWILIIFILALIKLSLVSFGLPNVFHPDEIYILKDPFKILFNYSNGNFDSPFNIIYCIQIIWFVFVYVLGVVFDWWVNISEFKASLIAEDQIFFISGRLLSLLISLMASVVSIKLVRQITSIRSKQYLLGLTILLNPFEIVSNMWIKYDPFVYLFIMLIVYHQYLYFVKGFAKSKRWSYLLIIIGASVRIDLLVMLMPLLLFEVKPLGFSSLIKYISLNIRLLLTCLVIYMLITLAPLVYFFNAISAASENSIAIVDPFWKVILNKVFSDDNLNTGFFSRVGANLKFYLIYCLFLGLGPLFFILLIKSFTRYKKYIFLITPFIVYVLVLLVFPSAHMHYFLVSSVLIIVLSFVTILDLLPVRFQFSFLLFNLLYLSSFTFSFLYSLHTERDTRLSSKEYILRNTDPTVLIGIEGFLNPGLFPPIDEYASVLIEKAKVTRALNLGTGLSLDAKAQSVSDEESRNIICLSTVNPWKEIGVQNRWSCLISDTSCVQNAGISLIVSCQNYRMNDDSNFSVYINNNYRVIKIFEPHLFDIRVDKLVRTEAFFLPFYLYEIL